AVSLGRAVFGSLLLAALGLLVATIVPAFLLIALEPSPLCLLLTRHVARLVARHATTTTPAAPASEVRRVVVPIVGRREALVGAGGPEAGVVPDAGHAAGRQDDAQERGRHDASHALPVALGHPSAAPHGSSDLA